MQPGASENGIRALFITTDYPPDLGGLQTYSLRIATELPGGILSHLLVGRDRPHADLPLPQLGVGVTSHLGRGRWAALLWSMWRIPYFQFGRGINFQIHMQWSTAVASWLLKKIGLGNPYIVLIHGAELLDPGRPWLRPLKTAILEKADAVIAGSHHTAEILAQQNIHCARLEVIHYGNPLEGQAVAQTRTAKLENQLSEIPRLLCMHRLVPRKGTALLIQVMAKLIDRPWTLDIVGRGEEERALRAQVEKLGLSERITFHAPVDSDRKVAMMSAASLFILPSLPPEGNNHFEGLGLTLLEAQSLRVPVLAANTGGIPEAVKDGVTGILFRAGDAEDLRVKLETILAAPEQLLALGKDGPEWVRSHFSWKDGLARLAAIMVETAAD